VRILIIRWLVSLLFLPLTVQPLSAQRVTIANATVIDVADGTLHPGTTVVIQGNRIARVGPASTSARPAGEVVDATGLYLIPGLWDMHVHAYFDWPRSFGDEYVLPLFIANGVTGIRDMGSDLESVLKARGDVAAHRLLGPRMVVSGPMLDGRAAPYKASMSITTAEDGRKAVDSLQRRGVDFIKIQSGVPRAAYFAAASEARRLGIVFVGHVPDAIRASEAVAAGQRSFEHLIGIFEASTPDESAFILRKWGAGEDPPHNKSLAALLEGFDLARESKLTRLLVRRRVWQCPTLFWERGQWLVDTVQYRKDPDLAFTPRSWIEKKFPAMQKGILGSLDTDSLAVRRRFVQHELEIVRRLHAAGVPFLAGTDTPAGVEVTPGISLHLELQRFVAAGFTPLAALQTATLNPAKFYGREKDFGSVQAGRIADLVLLGANPLEDIRNTRTIAGVIADGRYIPAMALDSMRARVRQVAARN
jgi:imidazolonepropionase-like amidohydrolase